MKRSIAALVVAISVSVTGGAQESAVQPYTDPGQLDVPWPKHSHYKQPWRGFLETRSGYDFLHGIGVNYNVLGPRHVELPRIGVGLHGGLLCPARYQHRNRRNQRRNQSLHSGTSLQGRKGTSA